MEINPFSDMTHNAQERGTGPLWILANIPPLHWENTQHELRDHNGNVLATDTRKTIHPNSNIDMNHPMFLVHGTISRGAWINWALKNHLWEQH